MVFPLGRVALTAIDGTLTGSEVEVVSKTRSDELRRQYRTESTESLGAAGTPGGGKTTSTAAHTGDSGDAGA